MWWYFIIHHNPPLLHLWSWGVQEIGLAVPGLIESQLSTGTCGGWRKVKAMWILPLCSLALTL